MSLFADSGSIVSTKTTTTTHAVVLYHSMAVSSAVKGRKGAEESKQHQAHGPTYVMQLPTLSRQLDRKYGKNAKTNPTPPIDFYMWLKPLI